MKIPNPTKLAEGAEAMATRNGWDVWRATRVLRTTDRTGLPVRYAEAVERESLLWTAVRVRHLNIDPEALTALRQAAEATLADPATTAGERVWLEAHMGDLDVAQILQLADELPE